VGNWEVWVIVIAFILASWLSYPRARSPDKTQDRNCGEMTLLGASREAFYNKLPGCPIWCCVYESRASVCIHHSPSSN